MVDGPSTDAGTRPPLHLALIFDRTCPDDAGWPHAYGFYQTARDEQPDAAPSVDRYFGTAGQSASPAAADYAKLADCNRLLRAGFGEALQAALPVLETGRFGKISLHPFWFQDLPSTDFNPFQARHVDPVSFGPEVERRPEHLFRHRSYVPSLDVFDPVEHALQAANARLRAALDADGGGAAPLAAVVIVGNSPPNFLGPDPRELAALDVFNQAFGQSFCSRADPHADLRWSAEVDAAASRGIAVVYALLTLTGDHAPASLSNVVDNVERIAACTHDALRCFPEVRLTDGAPADREGLAASLRQAFSLVAGAFDGYADTCVHIAS